MLGHAASLFVFAGNADSTTVMLTMTWLRMCLVLAWLSPALPVNRRPYRAGRLEALFLWRLFWSRKPGEALPAWQVWISCTQKLTATLLLIAGFQTHFLGRSAAFLCFSPVSEPAGGQARILFGATTKRTATTLFVTIIFNWHSETTKVVYT